ELTAGHHLRRVHHVVVGLDLPGDLLQPVGGLGEPFGEFGVLGVLGLGAHPLGGGLEQAPDRGDRLLLGLRALLRPLGLRLSDRAELAAVVTAPVVDDLVVGRTGFQGVVVQGRTRPVAGIRSAAPGAGEQDGAQSSGEDGGGEVAAHAISSSAGVVGTLPHATGDSAAGAWTGSHRPMVRTGGRASSVRPTRRRAAGGTRPANARRGQPAAACAPPPARRGQRAPRRRPRRNRRKTPATESSSSPADSAEAAPTPAPPASTAGKSATAGSAVNGSSPTSASAVAIAVACSPAGCSGAGWAPADLRPRRRLVVAEATSLTFSTTSAARGRSATGSVCTTTPRPLHTSHGSLNASSSPAPTRLRVI